MRRVYRMTLHIFDPPTTSTGPVTYDPWDPEVLFYTKSEPFHELTPAIRRAALEAIGDAQDPVVQARRIFRWTRRHMEYVYPPPGGRGAIVALREGKGDCGQYADLFIALCRAVGIPARFAGGFALGEPTPDAPPAVGSHAWAEFRLPDGRWLPADPTHDEERHFAHLLRIRNLTASVGRNLPLPHAPSWASYRFSDVENGRTEFMQTVTELSSGVHTRVRIQRRLLDPEDWPSEAEAPSATVPAR
jgi:transglutaminase-like putative cysteine protease